MSFAHVACDDTCDHDQSEDDEGQGQHQMDQSDDSSADDVAFLCYSCGPDADSQMGMIVLNKI